MGFGAVKEASGQSRHAAHVKNWSARRRPKTWEAESEGHCASPGRLKGRFNPCEDVESERLREWLRRAGEQLASMGHELPPPLGRDYRGVSLELSGNVKSCRNHASLLVRTVSDIYA
jgi:hypothetical protein